ncbi:MAG: fasciclin domain-containing protein [Opitutaceae bacterium]|nr:fasciclin domain-containing protein [Opitutaceae bacterium]
MKLRSVFAALFLSTGLVAISSAKTIVDIAAGSPDHTTLVAAVKAAGLVETLSSPGKFTVFAPTNAAFAKLPAGTVKMLLLPENKAKLVAILTYHVVPAVVLAADVKTGEAPTVNGKALTLQADAMGVTVNGAKVIAADLIASNGVIHVVDTVILP